MTEQLPAAGIDLSHVASSDFTAESVAPLITWLASADSMAVTGQVFEANGGMLAVVEGWRQGPVHRPKPSAAGMTTVVGELLSQSAPRTQR